MRRLRCAPAVLVLVAGFVGCDSTTPLTPTSAIPPRPAATPAPAPTDPSTIAIAGHVQDPAWRPLVGARVEVLDGPQAGLVVSADAGGQFRLAGTFDESTRFRASAPGHRDATRVLPSRCERCNPNWWIYFSLDTEAPALNLVGDYTLTFIADPMCSMLPEELRQRTYGATLHPSGSPTAGQWRVTVRGGTFRTGYDEFIAGFAGEYFAAYVGDLHGSPGIAEQIEPDMYLGFEGVVEGAMASSNASTLTGSLDGVISYCAFHGEPGSRYTCPSDSPATRLLCTSKRHQFILQRQ